MDRDIERIIRAVKTALPTVEVRQLQVAHPGADDDGVWWFCVPGVVADIQIDSSDGQCPFLVDYSDNCRPREAKSYATVNEVAQRIVDFFARQKPNSAND